MCCLYKVGKILVTCVKAFFIVHVIEQGLPGFGGDDGLGIANEVHAALGSEILKKKNKYYENRNYET